MRTLSFVALLFVATAASAETQTMTDPGSRALAKMLDGHSLICGSTESPSREQKGFFPLTVSAKKLGRGNVELSVATADPTVGFGFGGEEFDPVDHEGNIFVIACGDDGRRYLQFDAFKLNGALGESSCGRQGYADGEITGLVYEIWDPGAQSAEAVECCISP
jgi:hypothetical protein